MRVARFFGVIGVTFLLAACGGNDPTGNFTGEAYNPVGIVQWNRDPLAVVFRADVIGGDRTAQELTNTIPDCTLYGDGRVVYTQQNPNGNLDVIFDIVPDLEIDTFVNYLTLDKRIFTYDEGYLREVPQSVTPVYSQLTLEVNGEKHITDEFVSWEPNYYSDILATCKLLAKKPRLFTPQGAWVSAESVEPNTMMATIFWDAAAAGYSFTGLAAEASKRWIEGNTIAVIWDNVIVPPGGVQFNDGGEVFMISLQVPGVTLNSPAAPAQ